MLQQVALIASLVTLAAYVPTVVSHGNIIVPAPTGDSDHVYYFGGPAGTIDMPEIIGDASYGDYYEAVDEWFTENGVASLKEYITTYGTNISECGNTEKAGTAEPIPLNGYAEHDTLGNSHPGPCEIWCDDTRVFNNTNCVTEFSGQSPAMIPIDVSTCKASSEFVFYWLALHAQPWQVYINCVALDGTTSGSASATSDTTTSSTTAPTAASATDEATTSPTTTTDAPAAMTTLPSSTSVTVSSTAASEDDEASEADEADVATTTAPASTSATTTSADKCSVRRNRK